MNEKAFFDYCRQHIFNGSLSQSQVDGLNAILIAISPFSLAEQAYMLATAYWETAQTMQPVTEYGGGKHRTYGAWRTNSKGKWYCFKDGSKTQVYTFDEYPHIYCGRGLVQLTWWVNYERATRILQKMGLLDENQSLLHNPELANNPEIAAQIMCFGMKDGWFTGKKLSDYFGNGKKDYVEARRIINGKDKQHEIAAIAVKFEKALSS